MTVEPPPALGRGVLVAPGADAPPPWSGADRLVVDEAVLERPGPVVERLQSAWADRHPIVVECGVDPALFREPTSIDVDDVWRLDPGIEPGLDRLHHLIWANNYDARDGHPVWWWGRKAARAGGSLGVAESPDATRGDVVGPDGTPLWIDGGPRLDERLDDAGLAVVAADAVSAVLDGRADPAVALTPVPTPTTPSGILSHDQHRAVTHGAGPARVIAPAGSGKTRVLVERLRWLLGQRGVEPASVLAVAYNVRARDEIIERTVGLAPRVQTLNALGYRVLSTALGRRATVADERTQRAILDDLLPKRQRRLNTDPIGPYLEALGEVRLGLRDPRLVEARRPDVDGFAEVFDRYRAALDAKGLVDFDEQVYASIGHLCADGALRRGLQAEHSMLLVDEFQDLTPAHLLLLRLLSAPAWNVFAVGDDDQVIYGHAGADPRFLVDFDTWFPGAAHHALTVNHRCSAAVVTAASNLLAHNAVRVPKTIEAAPEAPPDTDRLVVVRHATDAGAATLVATVTGWLDQGVEPSDIAVLSRVHALLLAPTVALAAAGLPVSTTVGPELADRLGVRAALAWVRVASDPGSVVPTDLVEIHRRPSRGLPRWAVKWLERCRSVHEIRRAAERIDDDRVATRLVELADDCDLLAGLADSGATTRDLLVAVRDQIGLGGAMAGLDASAGGEGSSHLDDLEALIQVADLHPDPDGFATWLVGCLTGLGRGGRTDADDATTTGVTLSTVHRVKGREWPRVIVFGATDGLMPHRLSEGAAAREEERRVFHVAITRGRHHVVVLGDAERPSPFLSELDAPPDTAPLPPEVVDRQTRASRRDSDGLVTDTRRRASSVSLDDLTGTEKAAFQRLAAWRATRAKRDGVPPYVVAHDRTLIAVARAAPADLSALGRCHGIGPGRLDKYGADILEVLADV